MSLKIRLARAGAKKRPYYRIVVADSKSPRDGRYIEKIGTYDPLLPKDSAERVKLVEERVKHWLVAWRAADRPRAPLPRRRRHRASAMRGRTRTKASPARSVSSARRPRLLPPPRRPRPPPKPPPRRRRRRAGCRPPRPSSLPPNSLVGDTKSACCSARSGAAQGLKGEVRLRSFTAGARRPSPAYGPLEDESGRTYRDREPCASRRRR